METQGPSGEFRFQLQEQFLARLKRNPRYSIRAFAKSLEMDHSTLAKLMRGNRPLGKRVKAKLSARLGLTESKSAGTDYQRLSVDTMAVLSDWYHHAILELLRVDGFRPDKRRIARTFGLSLTETSLAIERLQRTGLMEITPRGKWIDRTGGRSTTVGNPFTAAAFRTQQRQLLEKAAIALEEIPMERRDHSNITMAIDSRLLPEAKEKIKVFRRELAQYLSRGSRRDEVFNLSLALFPLTQSQKQRRKPKQ